nr:mRNA-decapping enzyme-like protein [Nicotiana tomentosiformis]
MSTNGKLMPNLDQNSTKLLNLTVLQRIDPFVEEILITSAHVTFYAFNIDNSQWSRKDVEGSLFVVKRSAQPRFQFIVMNRRNTDNLVEDLLGDFEFEVQVPYLLYRNSSQEVNGIWFYNSRECEEVANLFNRILSAYSKVPTKFKLPSNKSEFEELEAVPNMLVIDGPLEPSSSTTSNTADVPDDRSFVNFFSTAMRIGSATNAAVQGQPYDLSATVLPPFHPPAAVPPSSSPALAPSLPLATSFQLIPTLDASEGDASDRKFSNLVKPSSFFGPPPSSSPLIPPVSSSVPTAPPLHPPGDLQRLHRAPLLQPFPPPTPPPSLTPASAPRPNNGPLINRDKVRETLLMLVQVSVPEFVSLLCELILWQ